MSQGLHPKEFSFMAVAAVKWFEVEPTAEELGLNSKKVEKHSFHRKGSATIMVAIIEAVKRRHSYLRICQKIAAIMAGYYCS